MAARIAGGGWARVIVAVVVGLPGAGPWSGVPATTARADQAVWPQFRGPGNRGVAAAPVPDRWSATENVAWVRDIPGRGWSSPVVVGDRVILTTVENTGTTEPAKKGLYFGGERPTPPEAVHRWKVLCLDLASGVLLWERQVHEGVPQTPIHVKSSYASETPVTDGRHVWCVFGSVGIWCLDLDGTVRWERPLPPRPMRYGWGAAASPALHDGRLYLCNDNEEASELVAYDADTGREVWRVVRDEKSNWSTPYVWVNDRRTEIVTPGTGAVRSYDLEGNLLWSLRGMSSITIATPYEADGLLYVSSGYVLDGTKPIYAIRPGAAGDITLPAGETAAEFIAWSAPKAAPYNPSTLVADGRLWVLHDRGFLACHDARTGALHYDSQRLPEGRAFTASPWYAAGKVFCTNEDGVTFVCDAGDDFRILHTNALAEDDMVMATPAIAGGRLLIRTAARVYCIGAVPAPSAPRPPEVVEHVTVFKETDRFAGWPANNGIWSWGDEIVVGFTLGDHDDAKVDGHPIKNTHQKRLARSLDGGRSWTIEVPPFSPDQNPPEPRPCPGGIDFTHPDFALRFLDFKPAFTYSLDRCRTWQGPFTFPDFGRRGILARTDYVVNGPHDMSVFITAEKDEGNEGWPLCARTRDGGATWDFVGWIGPQPPVQGYGYAIMPATVRLDNGGLLSIIRRGGRFDGASRWWLESFLSPDDGASWYRLEKPTIENAGNPASLVKLADGRLALVYGWRLPPYGLRAQISEDQGQSWGREIVLRADGDSWDIGYPRSVQRPDGRIVTIIYFKDASSKERYIAATIWDPGDRLTDVAPALPGQPD